MVHNGRVGSHTEKTLCVSVGNSQKAGERHLREPKDLYTNKSYINLSRKIYILVSLLNTYPNDSQNNLSYSPTLYPTLLNALRHENNLVRVLRIIPKVISYGNTLRYLLSSCKYVVRLGKYFNTFLAYHNNNHYATEVVL